MYHICCWSSQWMRWWKVESEFSATFELSGWHHGMARPYDGAEEVSYPGLYQSHIANYNTFTQTWQGHNTFVNTPTRKIQAHKYKYKSLAGTTTRRHVARHNPKPGFCHEYHQRGHPLWHLFWSKKLFLQYSEKIPVLLIVKKTNFFSRHKS